MSRIFFKDEIMAKSSGKPVAATATVATQHINIGISEKDRAAIAKGLSSLLVQYTELWNAVDPVAERIRALGHSAPGSYAQFSKLASVPDAPQTPPKALEMVRILVKGHEAVARTARSLLPVVDKASDEPTADLLTQRLTVHEQTAWMLRSLLEE